jgi:hypothetical protein
VIEVAVAFDQFGEALQHESECREFDPGVAGQGGRDGEIFEMQPRTRTRLAASPPPSAIRTLAASTPAASARASASAAASIVIATAI